MKKLQLLTLLALSGIAIQASDCDRGCTDESMDSKIERQRTRTQEQKDAYLSSKGNIRKETPEFRLIIKALEYKAQRVEGKISEEQFIKVMDNKEHTYRNNLKQNHVDFGDEQEMFLKFCKTSSLTEIASRLEDMKASGQQFMDQQS